MDWQFWIEKLVIGTAWLVVGIVVAIVFGHLIYKEKDDARIKSQDKERF